MEAWGWILVYLVGFTLFQLLLFRYFTDGSRFEGASLGSNEASSPRSVERSRHGNESQQSSDGEHDGDDENGIHCRHCGAYNADAQVYTYCQDCCRPLG